MTQHIEKISNAYGVGLTDQFPNIKPQELKLEGKFVGFFDRGVIYAEPNKPQALSAFLKLAQYQPEKIIFTDDSQKFIKEFEQSRHFTTELILIHYTP